MDNFDLNLLRVFDAVWRERQVTSAAQSLGLSQSAVSAALTRLRKHVGDPLFIKTRRGVQPTPYAERISVEVAAVLEQVRQRVLTTPHFEPAMADRWFTLGTSDLGETAFVPVLLEHFATAAPKVRLRTVTGPLAQRLEALEKGDIDLVLGHYPEARGADLMQRLLSTHRFVCLARRGHPAVRAGALSVQAYADAAHVVLREEARLRFDPVEEFLQARGVRRSVAYVASHFLSIPPVVARTDLIATVPASAAALHASDPRLQPIEPPFKLPRFDVKMYWHRKYHQDAAVRWLRDTVFEQWHRAAAHAGGPS